MMFSFTLLPSCPVWLLVIGTVWVIVLLQAAFSVLKMITNSHKHVANFDGPPKHWLKGHMDQATFDGHGLLFHLDCTAKFKTAYRLWFGPVRSALVLCHPETIKTVLTNPVPKEKFVYSLVVPFIGEGLTVKDGPKWHRMRKLLNPAFHYAILSPYVKIFQKSASIMLNNWSQSPISQIEVFYDVEKMTLDSILRCAFSYSSDCQTAESEDPYITLVYEIAKGLVERIINPFLQPDILFKLTSKGRQFFKNCANAREKAEKVIGERKEALQHRKEQEIQRQKKHRDFLDILLEAKDEEGNGLTDEEIRDEVMTFMFAGHDTTASSICWTLYNLARFPEHQAKCRDEVDAILKEKEELQWEDLRSLSYLQLCIKESMRMFTPVPVIGRSLEKTYVIDGKEAPEGTFILINFFALHRNPHVWEEPEKFDPLRFTLDNSHERSSFAFLPFSYGARNCIGMNFAMAEMKTSIALILQRFELSVTAENVIPIKDLFPEMVLRAKSGIRIDIKPRSKAASTEL